VFIRPSYTHQEREALSKLYEEAKRKNDEDGGQKFFVKHQGSSPFNFVVAERRFRQ
jgi:hypothetical protein